MRNGFKEIEFIALADEPDMFETVVSLIPRHDRESETRSVELLIETDCTARVDLSVDDLKELRDTADALLKRWIGVIE